MVKKKLLKRKVIKKKVERSDPYEFNISRLEEEDRVVARFDQYFKKIFQEMEQIRALVHAHSIGAQNVYNEFLKMKEKFAEFDRHFSRFGIK